MAEPTSEDDTDPDGGARGSDGERTDPGGRSALPWLAGAAVVAVLGGIAFWLAPRPEEDDAGGATDRPETSAPAEPASPEDAGSFVAESLDAVDLSGTWAEKSVQTSVTDIPIVGEVEARTITHRRIQIEEGGETVELRSELCGTKIESNSDAVRTVIPDAYIESAPTQERTGRLRLEEDGRMTYRIPRNCGVRGANLADPAEGELPTEPGDDRVVDGDDDGHPGVTVRVEGTISGRMSLVQRGCDAYRGLVRGSDRIRGTVEWSTEQEVLEANSMFLRRKTAPKPHPNPERSWFEMARVSESTDCAEILERSDELFGGSSE